MIRSTPRLKTHIYASIHGDIHRFITIYIHISSDSSINAIIMHIYE